MPENSAATSRIAAYVNLFALRIVSFVDTKDIATNASMTSSRKYGKGCQSVPTSGLFGSINAAAATMPPMYTKLIDPFKRKGFC